MYILWYENDPIILHEWLSTASIKILVTKNTFLTPLRSHPIPAAGRPEHNEKPKPLHVVSFARPESWEEGGGGGTGWWGEGGDVPEPQFLAVNDAINYPAMNNNDSICINHSAGPWLTIRNYNTWPHCSDLAHKNCGTRLRAREREWPGPWAL